MRSEEQGWVWSSGSEDRLWGLYGSRDESAVRAKARGSQMWLGGQGGRLRWSPGRGERTPPGKARRRGCGRGLRLVRVEVRWAWLSPRRLGGAVDAAPHPSAPLHFPCRAETRRFGALVLVFLLSTPLL